MEQSPPVVLGWLSEPEADPGEAPSGTFFSHVVQTVPPPRLWTEDVVHVGDCEIAPVESYALRATAEGIIFSPPLVLGTIEKPQGKFWGDIVGGFDGTSWSGPNGLVNVDDVSAWVKYVTLRPAPHVTVVDLAGPAETHFVNFVINATDLSLILQAFRAQPYPPPPFIADGYPADGNIENCP